MRNSGSWLWILARMVLALYSCLGDVTQQGTMLWPSTWERKLDMVMCAEANVPNGTVHTVFSKRPRMCILQRHPPVQRAHLQAIAP